MNSRPTWTARAWTAHEHDGAAHALNECCSTLGLGYPVAYANEL